MKLRIINVTQNPEIEQKMVEIYGQNVVDYLKNNIGQEFTKETNCKILLEAEKLGFVELEEIDQEKEGEREDSTEIDNDSEAEHKEDSDSDKKEEVEEQSVVDNDSEIEHKENLDPDQEKVPVILEDAENVLQNDEVENVQAEEIPKDEKTERIRRSLQIVAIQRLERLEVYMNLSSKEQAKLRSAYEDIRADEVNDIKDENFLDKRINDNEPSERMAGVRQVHLMVLAGADSEMNASSEQGETEISDVTSGEQSSNSKVRIIESMDLEVKAGAEREMAYRLKKFIEMATTNKTATQTLIVIGDLKEFMEDIKQDSLSSVDAGSDTEAVKLYLSQMPITEMGTVMAAMKDATEGVQVKFDDIDWNNEIERKVAINLLAQTQQVAQEIGSTEQVIDRVNIQFEVDDWSDIQEMTHTCKELKEAGIVQTTDVAAQVKIPYDMPIEQKEELGKAAGQVLATNGIEVEGKENDLVEAAIDGLSECADVMPSDTKEREEAKAKDIGEILGPGMNGRINT